MATLAVAASNGKVQGGIVEMPAKLSFFLHLLGTVGRITVKGRQTDKGVSYNGTKPGIVLRNEQGQRIPTSNTAAVDAALATLQVQLESMPDAVFNIGEPKDTAVQLYGAVYGKGVNKGQPHPKAGQPIPGTGGQRFIFAQFIGNVHGQLSTVQVKVTAIYEDGEDKGFKARCTVNPRTAASTAESEGFELL